VFTALSARPVHLAVQDAPHMIISDKKATRDHTKLHNRRLVFTSIYRNQQISRAEIARATDLTATTVSSVVSDLVAEGLVLEEASVPLTKGKPPILLSVNKNHRCILCLDLTSSSFRGAITNLGGEVQNRIRISNRGQTGDEALAAAFAVADALLASVAGSVMGIGVGSPGVVDPGTGIVRRAVNFGWRDLPLRDLLSDRYKLPTYVANASHAAVLAEYVFGRHKNTPDLVVVKVDHEVGAGIILNGQLFLGHGDGAGDIGHVRAVENGEPCTCGNSGCLETLCSSRAIVKRARAIARDDPGSLLHSFATHEEELDIDAVVRAYEAGDRAVGALVADVGHYLAVALSHLVGVLSVPWVLIAGSIANFGEPLMSAIDQEVRRRSFVSVLSQTSVERDSLGPDIVILGAAALFLHYHVGVM